MRQIPVFFDNIDRAAIVISVKEPFYKWLKSIDPKHDVSEMSTPSAIYLLPDYDDEADIENWLKKNYDLIFSDQLNNWYIDEALWVPNRTFKMFKEWFDYSGHLMIFDTLEDPIEKI